MFCWFHAFELYSHAEGFAYCCTKALADKNKCHNYPLGDLIAYASAASFLSLILFCCLFAFFGGLSEFADSVDR
jgi:hypothetical protein